MALGREVRNWSRTCYFRVGYYVARRLLPVSEEKFQEC